MLAGRKLTSNLCSTYRLRPDAKAGAESPIPGHAYIWQPLAWLESFYLG